MKLFAIVVHQGNMAVRIMAMLMGGLYHSPSGFMVCRMICQISAGAC